MANPTNKQADIHFGQLNQFQLLNEHEVAALLNVKVATLRRWRWAGKPPRFLKIGFSVRYEPDELAKFITAARRTSTTDCG